MLKKAFKSLLYLTLLTPILFVGYYFAFLISLDDRPSWHPRYFRYNSIIKTLSEYPGVEVIDAGGNEDLTFEDIWVTLNINEVEATIHIPDNKDVFQEFAKVGISKVGDHKIMTRGCEYYQKYDQGYRFYGAGISFGNEQSDFYKMFEKKYLSMHELVKNLPDIHSTLSQLPKKSDEKFVAMKNKVFTYWLEVEKNDTDPVWGDLYKVSSRKEIDFDAPLTNLEYEMICQSFKVSS